jgi:hypothetical protein
MLAWNEFAHLNPELATIGERMLRVNKDKPEGSLAGGLAYLTKWNTG